MDVLYFFTLNTNLNNIQAHYTKSKIFYWTRFMFFWKRFPTQLLYMNNEVLKILNPEVLHYKSIQY